VTKGMMEALPIDILENRSVTFYHVYQNYLWLSSHPEDSIEARWGLEKCEMIYAQTRATNDSIAFIDRAYRKKDPKYADFSIRQQQQILRRLSEEWTRSECREPPPRPEKIAKRSPPSKDSIEPRRGPEKCEEIRGETRATNDSIAFIEKTYRKKDPAYADFSIRQQQQLLQRLSEAWTRSGCGEPPQRPEKIAKGPPQARDLVEPRRGSKKCEGIRTETAVTNDSIAFIEKTYRKSDPAYADFSIRQQRQILQRLGEEWTRSGCAEPLTQVKKARK
jgi:hypothetical protein